MRLLLIGICAESTLQAWSIDVVYFWTHYNKYTKETDNYNGDLERNYIYNRTNKVFDLV